MKTFEEYAWNKKSYTYGDYLLLKGGYKGKSVTFTTTYDSGLFVLLTNGNKIKVKISNIVRKLNAKEIEDFETEAEMKRYNI